MLACLMQFVCMMLFLVIDFFQRFVLVCHSFFISSIILHHAYNLQSSVNYSKKAIKNHHGEVSVVVQGKKLNTYYTNSKKKQKNNNNNKQTKN